jgi:hypothetical protein
MNLAQIRRRCGETGSALAESGFCFAAQYFFIRADWALRAALDMPLRPGGLPRCLELGEDLGKVHGRSEHSILSDPVRGVYGARATGFWVALIVK